MIVGIGVDITSHKRFEHFIGDLRKLSRLLSRGDITSLRPL